MILVLFVARSPHRPLLQEVSSGQQEALSSSSVVFHRQCPTWLCVLAVVAILSAVLICGGFRESYNHDYMWVLPLLSWMLAVGTVEDSSQSICYR